MSTLAFLCDALYRGSQIVEGAVSTSILTTLAEIILSESQPSKGYAQVCIDKLPRGDRCQLQIDEERLKVSSSRKDEGFESDSETSSTTSTTGFEETLCGSPEIKVINDHVLRLEKLIRQDSGIHRCVSQTSEDGGSLSLSSSSGAESEEETPKGHVTNFQTQRESPTNNNRLPSTLSKVENGNGDFLMSDILFCHVLSHRPKVVIVVVKSVDTNLIAAHIFECLSLEAAKTLYGCYYSASNKFKLDRYRKSKRRCENTFKDDSKSKCGIQVTIKNKKEKPFVLTSEEQKPKKEKLFDNSNINVIEISDSKNQSVKQNSILQRVDENGVTYIEIESAPSSLPAIATPKTSSPKPSIDSFHLLSALERLSIHSSNNPDSYLNFVGVTSSCPNSLIQASREVLTSGNRKSRQREPPMLLKKNALSESKEVKKQERRPRSRSVESRKERENTPVLSESSSKVLQNGRIQNPDIKESSNQKEPEPKSFLERQSRSRSTSRPIEISRSRPRSTNNKRPAPAPPPRRHPNNPSLMLVPTKSGQEITRAYYPKESHIVRGSKVVRIDYPLYPPWNINSDINNNQQRMYYSNRGWYGPHEYHSNRRSDQPISLEMRKRSRSKSPARRPTTNRYIDAVSTFSLTQKIKDFSDTVIQTWKQTNGTTPVSQTYKDKFPKGNTKKEKKMNAPLTAAHFITKKTNFSDDAIRPVIKKGKKIDSDDNRRVTFSAYATVQLMDS